MTVQLPTRITIELHPAHDSGGWTARTAVDDVRGSVVLPRAAEPREEVAAPTAYEAAPCTCLEDGGCAADHKTD